MTKYCQNIIIALKTSDYVALVKPRLERIAAGRGTPPGLREGD